MRRFMKVFSRIVFSRSMIVFVSLLLQIFMIVSSFLWLKQYSTYIYPILSLLGAIVMIYLINKDGVPEFKTPWVIPICAFPIFGIIFYLFVEKNWGSRALRREMNKTIDQSLVYINQNQDAYDRLRESEREVGDLAQYLWNEGNFPVYHAAESVYFPVGEAKWKDMLAELENAKEFIFMEYFIIEPGIMLDSILDILKRKAAEGVEVRFMYDGMCSLVNVPYNYPKTLEKYGIETKVFANIVPFLSTHQNNRDHRKILVIDGKVAYTGGVNLADEYINKVERFGHWKDVAVKITGKAVDGFTMMFLQNWDTGKDSMSEYGNYLNKSIQESNEGYVIPYGDGPNRSENLAEKVYLHILNTAKDYVHIMTPYFIVDSTFLMMLKFAAQRGVDVKLILPHIPDKKYAFAIARRYYPALLEAGVKVYEYTPGFVHAKTFTSDGTKAVIGTINLDYRSLYHHFECGAYFYDNKVVQDAEADFEETLKKCQLVTKDYYKSIPFMSRLLGHICNLFAPLM